MLRKVPEFVSGRVLAESGKWSQAFGEFTRCSEVMGHAGAKHEAAVAGLYAATCQYYSGDCERASTTFVTHRSALSDRQAKSLADRFLTGLELEAGRSLSVTQTSDPWAQLSLGKEPQNYSFANQLYQFIQDPSKTLFPGSTSTELVGVAYANLAVASRVVSQLPRANVNSKDISKHVDLVSKSLRAGEAVAAKGHELKIASKWYIGRSLLLRGRLFEFNGNALMAEGMYRAAAGVVHPQLDLPGTPRLLMLRRMAHNQLGQLLLKWEKREREGESLLADNPAPQRILDVFMPEPVMEELDNINT